MKHIAVLDFGSQYTHLITKRIRELNILAKIYPHDASVSQLEDIAGIIISGGPQSVFDKNSPKPDKEIFTMNIPILGLCYGHQYIAYSQGGKVKTGKIKEYGPATFKFKITPIFNKVKNNSTVWMSHGDSVIEAPSGFEIIGNTSDCKIAAMANNEKKIYGFQFHPEVDHTEEGGKIISNFIVKICQLKQNWKVENIISEIKADIKRKVKNRKVLILVSGGVDSNVAFTLLTKTLGKKRVCGLYIDTGFMRKNESAEIIRNYKKIGLDNLQVIDSSSDFFEKLKNIYEPEQKRNIIGHEFLLAKEKVSQKLGLNPNEWMLGQGTIYPDIIESGGTKNADKIKTHHNRVEGIQALLSKGLVIEPLADFYKFEVRRLGEILRLPKDLIYRHPFPGPGLAIRTLCFDKNNSDNKFQIKKKKVINYYSKNFPKIKHELLPIKSVGVQGDNRTYEHPLAVWGENNWQKLDDMTCKTVNSIKEVNRVILLLNQSKSPKFYLPKTSLDLNPERIEALREIDDIIMKIIKKEKIYKDIWQFPVVLIPITDETGRESIVLRPFITRDVMTLNFARINQGIIKLFIKEILSTNKISYIFYDITNKPPGTVEWE